MKNKLIKVAAIAAAAIVILLAVAIVARNSLIRAGMETAVTGVTGFPFEVGEFSLGLTDTRVEAGALTLRNPDGFEDPRCLDIPRLVVDVDGSSLFGSELHIEEMVLDVAEVVVVRNADGETNLDRLKALGGSGGGKEKEGDGAPSGEKSKKAWKCDRLELTIGRVVLLDYGKMKDGKPKEKVWELDVDHEEFRDIDGPDKVVKLIVLKVLAGTPIELVNASIDSLTDGLTGIAGAAGSAIGGAGEKVGDALGGLLGGGK